MLESYFDESDSLVGRHPLLVIAGYLGDRRDWESFNIQWKRDLLDSFKITHFHSKELRSQNARFYRHLSFVQRREMLKVASAIICASVSLGIVGYMRPHDWNEFAPAQMRRKWGSCYGTLAELLMADLSKHRQSTERVSVFFEEGHANAGDVIRKLRAIKHDTEPIEWPEASPELMDAHIVEEDPARTQMMRIGDIALVSKQTAFPTQAADLLAYLISSSCLKNPHPVFDGILDALLQEKPHLLSAWGPKKVRELVAAASAYEDLQETRRKETWNIKKHLRGRGYKVYGLPWGLVVDKFPIEDKLSLDFRKQVDSIQAKFKKL
jgi:hypothetical protein